MKSRTIIRTLLALALAALVIAAFGCAKPATVQQSQDTGAASSQATTPAEQQATTPTTQEGAKLYTPSYKPNGNEVAVIKTNKGTIEVKLLGKDAPIAVGNFVELAQKGFYDKLKFHRFEPGFVIQGGDPQTKDLSSEKVAQLVESQKGGGFQQGDPILGTGGPGYVIKGEFQGNPNKHVDGTLAMARTNDPDSAGSQFYFTLGPQSFLDGNYTVFGQTTKGLEVIHKLVVGDVIESVTIENAAK